MSCEENELFIEVGELGDHVSFKAHLPGLGLGLG